MNLGIPHVLRVAAYDQKDVFQHIYIASFDQTGNAYIIDAVPEIPHFNYEEPYIDIKTINMDLVELSGLGATGTSMLEQEQQRDLIEELNAPFSLNGVEFDDDSDLEDHFFSTKEKLKDIKQTTMRWEKFLFYYNTVEEKLDSIKDLKYKILSKTKKNIKGSDVHHYVCELHKDEEFIKKAETMYSMKNIKELENKYRKARRQVVHDSMKLIKYV